MPGPLAGLINFDLHGIRPGNQRPVFITNQRTEFFPARRKFFYGKITLIDHMCGCFFFWAGTNRRSTNYGTRLDFL